MFIRFLLNGEAVAIERAPATRTLLDWLREERGLTGTKEGCNEGDCGACSVIVTDERGPRALNACILLLPQLHGRAVRTVEGLSGPNGEPHPVQRAMVEHHGSQCGFCTPGFVVTMAAAHLNGRRDHDDQLAGCLCRCTGYAPILRAARAAEDAPVPPWMVEDLGRLGRPPAGAEGRPSGASPGAERGPTGARITRTRAGAPLDAADPTTADAGSPGADGRSGVIRPNAVPASAATEPHAETDASADAPAAAGATAAYDTVAADWGRRDPVAGTGASDAGDAPGEPAAWVRPRSSDELAAWYLAHPDAILIAGATDVGLWVTKGLRDLPSVAFLAECSDLHGIEIGDDRIRIGAMASVEAVREALAPLHPSLGELLRRYGSVQVRGAATLGGNVANGSPIGDGPPPLIALGATLHLRRGDARRSLPLEDFFIDYGQQDRLPGEFVEAIAIPRQPDRLRCHKLSKRFDQDISAVCGAFVIRVEDDRVTSARVAFGGMAPTPRRARAVEAALTGEPWTEPTVRRAMAAFAEDFQPISDMRASAEYRLGAARNMLLRCWLEDRGVGTQVLGGLPPKPPARRGPQAPSETSP